MHVLQTVFATPNTKWADVLYLLEHPDLWDPKDVTELFAYDREIRRVRTGNQVKPMKDWCNKKTHNRQRNLSDVGLHDGSVLIVSLERAG